MKRTGKKKRLMSKMRRALRVNRAAWVGGRPCRLTNAEAHHDFAEGAASEGFDEGGVEDVEQAGGPVGEEEKELRGLGDAGG